MPAGGPLLWADVNQAVEERAGRYDERAAFERVPVFHRNPDNVSVACQDASRLAEKPRDIRFRRQRHRAPKGAA